MKIAKVIPLFKSGDRELVGNYRPISILPTFSKILERIVYNQLLNYFDRFKLFTNSQFGFRRQKSTAQAILDNVQYIYDNLDRGDLVASFFLDFQKAFDCVSHKILLSKLSTYGIRGMALEWFRSFLTNRKQFTNINNTDSSIHSINCGVPQGSILSPLLFLIYINDFPECSSYFKFVLFADDSTLSCKVPRSSLTQAAYEINNELKKIHTWLHSNKIKLNINKSTFLAFSYRAKIDFPPISLDHRALNQSENTKFLGMIVDDKLNFQAHIKHIKSKLSKSIGILHKLKHMLPYSALLTVYQSLIVPYINYAIETWHSAPQSLLDQIFILQKKAIRAIHLLPYNEHTHNYFKSSNLLKMKELYRISCCSQIYLAINSESHCMNEKLKAHYEITGRNTRNQDRLILPFYRKAKTQACFIYSAINEWNSIPETIKNSKTLPTFKYKLRNFYLSQYS